MAAARLSDVDAWRAAERPGPTRSRVVWGPVDAAAAALAGCARGVQSLCIVPRLTPFLVAAALGCIPHDVRAKCTDTADVLAERLGQSGFLDDAHVLRGGNGKRKRGQSMRVRLNETTYPAPAGSRGRWWWRETLMVTRWRCSTTTPTAAPQATCAAPPWRRGRCEERGGSQGRERLS